MARIKAASFDDRMTLVEHLDELRTRLIICGVALVIAAIVCFWQNHLLLDIANGPLPDDVEPLTFSPSEPFLTTLTLVLYSAILVTLPIILYQAYAFILPALTPGERKVILPILLMVPVLFVAGVVFAYFVVVPAAVKFLLNFNDDQFNIQIRAREYLQLLLAVADLRRGPLPDPDRHPRRHQARDRHPRAARQNRRYAILIIAVLAMLLPGTDPITMLLSMLPLVLLFEFSLIVARVLGRPAKSRESSSSRPSLGRTDRLRTRLKTPHAAGGAGGAAPGPRLAWRCPPAASQSASSGTRQADARF